MWISSLFYSTCLLSWTVWNLHLKFVSSVLWALPIVSPQWCAFQTDLLELFDAALLVFVWNKLLADLWCCPERFVHIAGLALTSAGWWLLMPVLVLGWRLSILFVGFAASRLHLLVGSAAYCSSLQIVCDMPCRYWLQCLFCCEAEW